MQLPKGTLQVEIDEQTTLNLDIIEYQFFIERTDDPEEKVQSLVDRVRGEFGVEIAFSQAWSLIQAINLGYLEYKKKFDHSLTSHFGTDLKLYDLTPEMESFLQTKYQDIGPPLSSSSESPEPPPPQQPSDA